MFPDIYFELYDPNPFKIKPTNKININQQFFTDKDANHWKTKTQNEDIFTVLISDIRTEPATDENVSHDMALQRKWWEIMNPDISMFKFRLSWKEGRTEYMKGDIYIQVYPGPTSTETRLIVKKNAPIISYDNKRYEDLLFCHNTLVRPYYHEHVLGQCELHSHTIDNCYDCASFVQILNDYIEIMNPNTTPNVIDVTKNNEKIYNLVLSIQKGIDGPKQSICTRTVDGFKFYVEKFYKSVLMRCDKPRCPSCIVSKYRIDDKRNLKSKASLENYRKASEKK
jgi:hypothetical protein